MSVDYRGELSSGLLSRVTNSVNGKKYNISTVWNARRGEWETAAFEQTLLGAFRHLICMSTQDENRARRIHDWVENTAEQIDPKIWDGAKLESTKILMDAECNSRDSGSGIDDAIACLNRDTPQSWQPTKLITPEDEEAYGVELIDLAMRAAREAMGPELNALRQELHSRLTPLGAGNVRSTPQLQSPTKLITPEDEEAYGVELIDLAMRAAREAMVPELNALRQELHSRLT